MQADLDLPVPWLPMPQRLVFLQQCSFIFHRLLLCRKNAVVKVDVLSRLEVSLKVKRYYCGDGYSVKNAFAPLSVLLVLQSRLCFEEAQPTGKQTGGHKNLLLYNNGGRKNLASVPIYLQGINLLLK